MNRRWGILGLALGGLALVLAAGAALASGGGLAPGGEGDQPPDQRAATPVLDLVVADLAERLGVDSSAVLTRHIEDMEWPDASLGAPEPGRTYAQVVTPGYVIELEAEGGRYTYHTDLDSAFRLVSVAQ